MTQAIRHRGPDDEGIEALGDGHLWFGHRRLSIVDLSALGHQPMRSADGGSWIVYNGEVYNFAEIRRDLELRGHRFRGHSDTEVILAAWVEWGPASVERFRGMFAFALWDARRRELHLCRDRFGVKPLFFVRSRGMMAFASEIKALHAVGLTGSELDPQALGEYVQYGYVTAPRTLYAAVRAVTPGSILTFGTDLVPRERTYWSVTRLFDEAVAADVRRELASLPEAALLDRVEDSLQRAFAYRMIADVPVGLFLSGGIDSSLVAGVLAHRSNVSLRTFTIGYGGSEFDETAYARQVAGHLGAEHTEFIVSPSEMLGLVDRVVDIADEPIGDSSLLPTLMVSELAVRSVKVALSADGADELFGGYARYPVVGNYVARFGSPRRALQWLAAETLDRLPKGWVTRAYAATRGRDARFAAIDDKLRKFVRMSRARTPFDAYEAGISEWGTAARVRLGSGSDDAVRAAQQYFDAVDSADSRARFMHFDTGRYLPGDLLTKVDRASMAVSLEAREPFLDHDMASLATALPMSWKVNPRGNKYVLRRLLDRHFPARWFDRPKHGFSAPVAEWLRGPLRETLRDELSVAAVQRAGILDGAAVAGAVDGFLAGSGDASPAGIWYLFQLQRWANRWLFASPAAPAIVPVHAPPAPGDASRVG